MSRCGRGWAVGQGPALTGSLCRAKRMSLQSCRKIMLQKAAWSPAVCRLVELAEAAAQAQVTRFAEREALILCRLSFRRRTSVSAACRRS